MLCFRARRRQRQPMLSPSRYHLPLVGILTISCRELCCHVFQYTASLSFPPLSSTPPSLPPHRHIETSLGSLSTQINFFIHNLAQFKFQAASNAPTLLSFCPQSYSIATDGKIESAIITTFHKRFYPETYYVCVCVCECVCGWGGGRECCVR